jgi:hypothetical protein
MGLVGFFRRHGLLLGVLAIAFAVRWPDLMLHAIDWDETNVLAISRLPFFEMIRFTCMHDFHPPGIHLTVAAWTGLFGSSDHSLRFFSLFWSLLSVWASYALALQLAQTKQPANNQPSPSTLKIDSEFAKSHAPTPNETNIQNQVTTPGQAIAVATLSGLMMAFMPLGIRYAHFATSVPVFLALFLASWLFLLQHLDRGDKRSLWLYGLTAFWATQQYASGPFFLLFQGLYVLAAFGAKRWRKLPKHPVFWVGLSIALINIPHIMVVMQPWHLAQSPAIKALHPAFGPGFFWLSPLIFLFYNVDLRTDGNDLSLFPPALDLLLLTLWLYPALGWAWRILFREDRPAFRATLLIGPAPLTLAYLLTLAGGSLFNYRSLLYAGFAFVFALAFLIVHCFPRRRLIAGTLTVGLFCFQLMLPQPLDKFSSIDWRVLGKILREQSRPTDGLLAYPGFMAMPLIRYAYPQDFGYSQHVRQSDPTQGDHFFNQVDRIEGRYFMVSGADAANRPWVKEAFVRFQKDHPRIILFGQGLPPSLLPLMDCRHEFYLLAPSGLKRLQCFAPPQ